MTLEHLIVLALIQGLTEFLPVSSSAHLILVPLFADWPDQGPLVDLAVHAGSLAAVMIYFRRDVRALAQGAGQILRRRASPETRLLGQLVLATLPIVAVGAALKLLGLIDALRSPAVIAWTTVIFGGLLYVADRRGAMLKRVEDLSTGGAFWIGLSQCLAVLPGTSRSGITITTARALGMTRPEAARFSMLLALPTILIFALAGAADVVQSGDAVLQHDVLLVAGLSFAAALLSISVFMALLTRVSLLPFVLYRLFLGAGLLLYVYGG